MSSETYVGVACIIFGVIFTLWSIKTWKKGDDLFTSNVKGLIAGVGSIIAGIMFLLGKLHL